MPSLRSPPSRFSKYVGFVLAFGAFSARAEAVDGDYTSTALREDYTIQNWQSQCGPVPKSTSTGGGAKASIRESNGVLSIASTERSYASNRCYDTMSTLKADAAQHDAAAGTWRIRCATPEADPRKAVMNTLVAIGKGRVDVIETGRYEIRLQGGYCVADVRRTQAFVRAAAAAAAEVDAAAPAPVTSERSQSSEHDCSDPGPAAKLELSPIRKVAVAGSEFRIRVDASDASGCATAPTPTITGGDGLTLEGKHDSVSARKEPLRSLLVRVPEDAAEGAQTIVFQQGKAESSVSVEIVSKARYDELFATGELQTLEEIPDGGTSEPIRFTTPAHHDASGEARKRKFLLLVGILVAALALMGLVLSVRARRSRSEVRAPLASAAASARSSVPPPLVGVIERPPTTQDRTLGLRRAGLADTARQPPAVARDLRTCPVCSNEFDAPLQFCPHDGAQLGSGKRSDAPGVICPVCRRGFDASVQTCPDHGEELVPKTALGHHEGPPQKQAKICPTCGDRFEGQTAFCGKDGTALVVLN